uniref:Serine/threonine/tyrosine interacting-like 1 n=1 Tax=Erpetoichthys calabaricus TaxID=27687 RepID=A0A8C4SML7_ERPCA
MAGMVLCEPTELYNILNQYTTLTRLADPTYLCLLDARIKEEYERDHIITAQRSKKNENDEFLPPVCIDLECVQHCVVYDGYTASLHMDTPAIRCAEIMEQKSQNPVHILKGGYESFSALYPFLRTVKIIYTPQELESLLPYPVEILQHRLYMGDLKQAENPQMLKDLKIKAQVNVSGTTPNVSVKGSSHVLDITVSESTDSDLSLFFQEVCEYIDSHLNSKHAVLVFSRLGISRSSTVIMAFLVYHLKCSLQDAWTHVLKCRTRARPHRGFVQQLSTWEEHVLGNKVTDISDPNF